MKRTVSLIFHMAMALSAAMLVFSCKRAPSPVYPPQIPVITDLSGELGESERCFAIRFSVKVGIAEHASVEVFSPDGGTVYSSDLTDTLTVITVDGLEQHTVYTVNATAVNGTDRDTPAVSSASENIQTASVPEYLTLLSATENSYSFRVFSLSETGFLFTSGEYDALEWLVPGWNPDDQESLKELMAALYPFEGHGDMTIECVDGEQPEWAQIPVEVWPDKHYFIMAADKDADGNIVGDVAFIDFNTL